MKNLSIHLFFILFLLPDFSQSQWSQDPNADTSILLGSFFNAITSDGCGGVIIIGRRDYQYTAQRVDQNGYVLWDLSLQGLEVIIPDSVNDVTIGRDTYLWPDSKGGVFIAYDYFDFLRVLTDPEYVVIYDIDTYVQHLNAEGKRTWGTKGIPLSTLKGTNPDYYYIGSSRVMALGSDGCGGIVTVWEWSDHDTLGNEVTGCYIQRIDSSGQIIWEKNGRKIHNGDAIRAIIGQEGSSFAITYIRNGAELTTYLIKANVEGQLLWDRRLSIPINNIIEGRLIFDGFGGVFILHYSYVNQNDPETKNIIAQRFDKDGYGLWGEQGIVICDSIGSQGFIESAIKFNDSDLILSWTNAQDRKNVYLQRINCNGKLMWGERGIPVSSIASLKMYCHLLQSSENEIIAAFYDSRDSIGITYAQKFNENGQALWGENDVLVSTRIYPGNLVSDGRRGAIICGAHFSPRGVCIYRVDENGNLGGVVSVKDPKKRDIPKEFDLYQNHPNPFMNETVIGYLLPHGAHPVQLKIYDINGKEVMTLVNETQATGSHAIKWSGLNNDRMSVASGLYFYQLQIGHYHLVKKLLFFR